MVRAAYLALAAALTACEAPAPEPRAAEPSVQEQIQLRLQEELAPPAATAPWSYSTHTDSMRGTTGRTACTMAIRANGQIFGEPPASLCLQSYDGSDVVGVSIVGGEMIDCSSLECAVPLKFDDTEVSDWRVEYLEGGGGGARYAAVGFVRSPRVLQLVRDSRRVTAEVMFYEQGRVQLVFDVTNLTWPLPQEENTEATPSDGP